MPKLSKHFSQRSPSAIRQAQILFAQRADRDTLQVINVAIGNVSLPMHPAMLARLHNLDKEPSPFASGVVKYTPSVGLDETQQAFMRIIQSAGCPTESLHCVVTDGGSQAMELMVLGVCGPSSARPLMLLDPAYTNYVDMARRAAVPTLSVGRVLGKAGHFSAPDIADLLRLINDHRPSGLVVIPADNPTGQFLHHDALCHLARLCVKSDLWMISDEAYRQLHYTNDEVSSIWAITEEQVPGISGRRISIESASKVWNACGLRIGALVTDNREFQARAVAEYTANLSANAVGQWVFGALAHIPVDELRAWYDTQRTYYTQIMGEVTGELRASLPGVIVSNPEASLYSVIDVRDIAPDDFNASDFVSYCACEGRVHLQGKDYTLLVAPMGGFYGPHSDPKIGRTQMRLAYVESPEAMRIIPMLFAQLFRNYVDGQAR